MWQCSFDILSNFYIPRTQQFLNVIEKKSNWVKFRDPIDHKIGTKSVKRKKKIKIKMSFKYCQTMMSLCADATYYCKYIFFRGTNVMLSNNNCD